MLSYKGQGVTETVSNIPEKPLGYRFIKRLFDIVFSALAIIIGIIPTIILCILVIIDTKGAPFFLQDRVGKNGRDFKIVKFRTMVADAEDFDKYFNEEQLTIWELEHKLEDDPRVTKVGRFLRKYSIDEMPNFLNVFIGQMSVVGPRAITREELEFFGDDADLMLSVPAGVTGWWQVSSRNDATFESGERQELELYYARNASLALDAKIFIKTFSSVFGGTGI